MFHGLVMLSIFHQCGTDLIKIIYVYTSLVMFQFKYSCIYILMPLMLTFASSEIWYSVIDIELYIEWETFI